MGLFGGGGGNVGLALVRRGPPPPAPKQFWGFRESLIIWDGAGTGSGGRAARGRGLRGSLEA